MLIETDCAGLSWFLLPLGKHLWKIRNFLGRNLNISKTKSKTNLVVWFDISSTPGKKHLQKNLLQKTLLQYFAENSISPHLFGNCQDILALRKLLAQDSNTQPKATVTRDHFLHLYNINWKQLMQQVRAYSGPQTRHSCHEVHTAATLIFQCLSSISYICWPWCCALH